MIDLKTHCHQTIQRIYYEDTDFSGVVYHTSYLRFFERGRTEWLRSLGIKHKTLFESGYTFVVSQISVNFIAPAYIDDQVVVVSQLRHIRRARFIFKQSIQPSAPIAGNSNPNGSLVEATVSVVLLNNQRRPVRITEIFSNISK